MINALAVQLEDTPVGVLYRFEDENYRFTFDESWLQDPQRPILGQIFEDRRPDPIETSGMPCWFAHLLPQGPLRRLLLRQAEIPDDDEFDLLAACGDDLPGALGLSPMEARIVPQGLAPRPLGPANPPVGGRFSFSLAGNQWKMSVRPGDRGLVIPVRGEMGTWIGKFQDPSHAQLPRVEYATSCWARAAGIVIPSTRLVDIAEFAELPEGLPTAEREAFLIERFDRRDGQRVHTEDFGQILDRPPGDRQMDGDYVELAAQLSYLTPEDLGAFIAQLVFCVLSGNGDAHLKNWSVIYPDRRRARLSPAYDLVPTILYYPRDRLALSLAGARAFTEVGLSTFLRLAASCRQSEQDMRRWVGEAVGRTIDAWHNERTALPFTDAEREQLDGHMAGVPLAKEGAG